MFLRVVLTLFIASIYSAQNSLIIFSAKANYFNATCKEIPFIDSFQQELKVTDIKLDTLHLNITLKKDKTTLQRTVFLLEKGQPVNNKEFIFSLEQDDESKKLNLVFITVTTIKKLPNPLVPPKPKEDTTYKWRNNVYGNVFELKDGKPIFYLNIPKNNICNVAMADANLNYAIQLLERTAIESERYKYASDLAKNNCLSCLQANRILAGLNYELDKLKLLKEIYPHLIDKANFKTLRSSFKFESSKKEFDDIALNPNSLNAKNKIICTKAVSDSVVNSIAGTLKLYSTDFEKHECMKEKYFNLCLNSAQFKSILQILIHDREKFDLVKLFYNNITDKENLGILTDLFSYKETIIDYANFLKQPE